MKDQVVLERMREWMATCEGPTVVEDAINLEGTITARLMTEAYDIMADIIKFDVT